MMDIPGDAVHVQAYWDDIDIEISMEKLRLGWETRAISRKGAAGVREIARGWAIRRSKAVRRFRQSFAYCVEQSREEPNTYVRRA